MRGSKKRWWVLCLFVSSCVVGSNTAVAEPDTNIRIEIKSNRQTFNHRQDFIIDSDKIWYRSQNRDVPSEWKEIPLRDSVVPVELRADGANFMFLDSNRQIHYKKVLEEKRTSSGYRVKDLAGENNWVDRWFNVPVVGQIVGLFEKTEDQLLQLPAGAVSWSVSHRGLYSHFFEDTKSRKHPEFAMVTTVYMIPAGGQKILYADPYLLGGFSHRVEWPSKDFFGEHIASSASTLLVVGREYEQLAAYVSCAPLDFDTMGHNPFLPGFLFKSFRAKNTWERLDLPNMEGLESSPDQYTIFQTGEGGNNAREIRIGVGNQHQKGFFSKKITETGWQFQTLESR